MRGDRFQGYFFLWCWCISWHLWDIIKLSHYFRQFWSLTTVNLLANSYPLGGSVMGGKNRGAALFLKNWDEISCPGFFYHISLFLIGWLYFCGNFVYIIFHIFDLRNPGSWSSGSSSNSARITFYQHVVKYTFWSNFRAIFPKFRSQLQAEMKIEFSIKKNV